MRYGKDRRESKRISYLCEVECEGAGLSRLATRIADLSMSGAFIDSITCYAPGTNLKLRFHINDLLIETAAAVRYSMPKLGMGVQFMNLAPEHISALENLIDGKPLTPLTHSQLTAASSNWNALDMLLGNFAIVSVFDVIQMIENNRLDGVMGIISPSANGEIYFSAGHIVGAQSGPTIGIDALRCFLDVTEGSFEFNRTTAEYQPTIEAPNNMSLMMDLMRIKDEETAALSN